MNGEVEMARAVDGVPGPASPSTVIDAAVEAVDLSVFLSLEEAQVAGEPDLVVELIDLYAEDTPRRLAAMKSALAAGDLAALRRAAHGLKGSSASLGARRVALLCEELERLPGAGLLQGGETILTGLCREFARVRLAFADERDRRLRSRLYNENEVSGLSRS